MTFSYYTVYFIQYIASTIRNEGEWMELGQLHTNGGTRENCSSCDGLHKTMKKRLMLLCTN